MILNLKTLKTKLTYKGTANGGRESKWLCPFCEGKGFGIDKRGHLYINTVTGNFLCHRCNTKGQKAYLERYLGLPPSLDLPIKKQESITEAPISAVDLLLFELIDKITPISQQAYDYLIKRGLTEEQIIGYKFVEISTIKDRVCLPIIQQEKLIAFQCRTYTKDEPKYLFQPRHIKINDIFFHWDIAQYYSKVYLVEGIFDAISLGFNALAMFGHYLSNKQLELLIDSKIKEIIIMLDRDTETDSIKIANRLNNYFDKVGYMTWQNIPSEFKDIDEIHQQIGQKGVDLVLSTQIQYV